MAKRQSQILHESSLPLSIFLHIPAHDSEPGSLHGSRDVLFTIVSDGNDFACFHSELNLQLYIFTQT